MMEMPLYINPISLIPGGCPQLLDYEAPAATLDKLKYGFAETPEKGTEGKSQVRLHVYGKNSDGDFADELNPAVIATACDYEAAVPRALSPWLNQWLPVPFLRTREQTWPDSNDCKFEYGPTNWARARLSSAPQGAWRLVLAFDMQVEESQDSIYAALTRNDVDANAHFRLAWRFRDNAWFLKLAWVDEWLRELWLAHRRKGRPTTGGEEWQFEHMANYLVYLAAVQRISNACEVYVVRPDAGCVDVDLVLDIGNSRTTGILVETQAQSATSLNNSYLLQLRDMDEPDKVYVEPFETRVEFSEIHFGNDALSLRSGRRTPAFVWPSPVRIGPEAGRLATLSRCEKGSTGMSSPKRYLWDERNWLRTWRFNTKSENSPYVTRGPLAQRINSSGTPLCCMDDRLFTRNRILRAQEKESAFESLFTRSSLMMLLFVEIIQQALLTINAPGQRLRRDLRARPRRLRQIIFTMPAGMPMAEQNIYRRWGLWAVHVLWDALGWSRYYLGNSRKPARNAAYDYRTSPIVRCDWDEATCTQLVFIYNEIVHKFQGDARLFCRLLGRERNFGGHESPSIRIAAIDIGGGTTDLSITTFELASANSAAPRLVAHPDFHDGFNLAGDDILRAVIADHVLPAIGEALAKIGVPDVQAALSSLFGRAIMDSSRADLNRRIQFIRQIATPVGLCLLSLYEQTNPGAGNGRITFTLGDCFSTETTEESETSGRGEAAIGSMPHFPMPSQGARDYLKTYAAEHAPGKSLDALSIPVTMDAQGINETVKGALREVLANLCEVINMYDCDALLLTGRPSRWPGVVDTITSLLPVPPSRIYPMSDYRVSAWYPFADAMGNVTDPKTTVVVGAILCALAEGQLEGFSFDPHNLGLTSTARHIGEMELNGQIKKNKIWFEVQPEKSIVEPEEREILFNGPISVGFRQLAAERWTTTRFYMLDYVNSQDLLPGSIRLPLKVRLKLNLPEEDTADRDEGEFEIDEIVDADGNSPPGKLLEMRLQTLPRDDGFWMDTGVVYED